jgi:uncharacterized repeat protein (TIGR03833 family)
MSDFRRKSGNGQGLFLTRLPGGRKGVIHERRNNDSSEPVGSEEDSGVVFKEHEAMNGTCRDKIKTGQQVLIVLKKDQRSGKLTRGIVKNILTHSPTHPYGIKVRLESGEVGRVKQIVE